MFEKIWNSISINKISLFVLFIQIVLLILQIYYYYNNTFSICKTLCSNCSTPATK